MKKYIIAVCVLLVCVICLQSCGYNNIMYDHLSDSENYQSYSGVLESISYVEDAKQPMREDLDAAEFASAETVFLYVVFASPEPLASFWGVPPENIENLVATYTVRLEICAENHNQLMQNGFYNAVKAGDEITVTASNWTYMDGKFYYVIGVACGEQVYLNPTVGLQNVIDMMNQQRGLL